MLRISVVIPAYREGEALVPRLRELLDRQRPDEVIVVDASSKAEFLRVRQLAVAHCDGQPLTYLAGEQTGRAAQMNQGAAQSRGEVLLFLHADTHLPGGALSQVQEALEGGARWGRFDVRFDNPGWPFRLIAFMMNLRSRVSGIATGDQAMFMTREAYSRVGGFDQIPLMEDVSLSGKLKKLGRPACLRARVTTAARRWEQNGVLRTILLMWWLRLAYRLGVSPDRLAEWYRK